MIDRFALVIADLAALIDVPIHLDHTRQCSLYINNALHALLSEEENMDRILISTFIGELPPGKFQEIVLKELLKENNLFPRVGTFCYSRRNHQVAFFTYVSLVGLRGDLLADALEVFLDHAFSWRMALETGQIPSRGHNLQRVGPSVFDIQK